MNSIRSLFEPSVLAACLFALATLQCAPSAAADETAADDDWILKPSTAADLVENGDATILDARSEEAWDAGHVARAVRFDWEAFTPSADAERGRLLRDDATLQSKLQSLGVSADRPVVVVGASDGGWGESGRAVWMLRTLGHDEAAWVDGGHAALVAEGVDETTEEYAPEDGEFEVERRSSWSISKEQLRSIYREDGTVLLDTREPGEYSGETPYGESRGGHIPGAQHLYFKDLLRADGRLRSATAIRAEVESLGAGPDDTVVTYCTGGVRSAWVASVLLEIGYSDVRNYAGSTWQWSSGSEEKYPLETD